MKTLTLAFVMLLSTCTLAPAQLPSDGNAWVEKAIVCTTREAAEIFYTEEGLYPLLGGTGQAWSQEFNDWFPTATFVLINDEGGMAVMEYHQDGTVCSLAFGQNIEFDADNLRGYMR
jgi:hypothetical protein